MQKYKSLVIFSTVSLNLFFLVALLFLSTDGMIPPRNEFLALFCIRMMLFSSVTILGPFIIIRDIYREVITAREVLTWGLPIFGIVIVLVSLSAQFENHLYFAGCCGEGNVGQWGYPFAYLKGFIYSGGKDIKEFSWIALLANINFGLNLSVTMIEIGKYFRKQNAKVLTVQS